MRGQGDRVSTTGVGGREGKVTMPASSSGASYLVFFGDDSAKLLPLPARGSRLLGSSPEADITIDDESIAQNHALIEIDDDGATIRAVAASTFVNDEPVRDVCEIRSGDVVRLGDVLLSFHGTVPKTRARGMLTVEQMRRRVTEETERLLRYGRPVAFLMVLAEPEDSRQESELLEAASKAVRVVDVVAWDGRRELWALFPETSDTARIPAQRVLDKIRAVVPDARAGLALCPFDGVDAEGLIAGARAAAKEAKRGSLLPVAEADHTMAIGSLEIVAADPLMRSLFELIRRIAASEIPVLIMGETGAGKEIVAQAVHAWSRRKDKRMVSINCAAVPETLLESELFGHDKGAFTGATTAKAGLFEEASGGTVFLDEIGECSPRTQAELLRVLETKRFCRVGSLREREANVRIVAATNRPLEQEIAAGRFRQDLYFRLNTATLMVPPLRDRPLDVPVLARAFLEAGCKREGREPMRITSAAMQRIVLHDWPGNVREIRNLMDFLSATVQTSSIEGKDLPPTVAAKAAPWMLPKDEEPQPAAAAKPTPTPRPPSAPAPTPSDKPEEPPQFRNLYEEIQELEKTRIQQALEATGGVRNRAAELIGIPLRTLVTKIKVYDLGPPPPRQRRKRKKSGE